MKPALRNASQPNYLRLFCSDFFFIYLFSLNKGGGEIIPFGHESLRRDSDVAAANKIPVEERVRITFFFFLPPRWIFMNLRWPDELLWLLITPKRRR